MQRAKMTKLSVDEEGSLFKNAVLVNGYDYDNQAWVLAGRYVRCGHLEEMDCRCYGKKHQGEEVRQET